MDDNLENMLDKNIKANKNFTELEIKVLKTIFDFIFNKS